MATPKKKATPRRPSRRRVIDKKALADAVECARIADSRRGEEIVVLHIEEKILVTDYFVIVNGFNKRQIQAIAFEIRQYLSGAGHKEVRMEGYEEASWVLIDCGPVVVHVFRQDLRSYYDLELLWGDSPKIAWQKKPSKNLSEQPS